MSLVAKNISFHYAKTPFVFKDVSLEVHPGEVVGIYGVSGCGKSSLAKALAGYIDCQEGKILVDGKKQEGQKFQEVQLIFQHPEKTMNPLWRMHSILTEAYEPSTNLLKTFGIREEWFARYPIELSGGELQRFAIVRALHPDTKYLIADEMTTMLDAVTQAFIWKQLLSVVVERNLGLIVISHERDIIRKTCDRCFEMKEAKLYDIPISYSGTVDFYKNMIKANK